jgi:dTDP-glucose 4,6-dehydratase
MSFKKATIFVTGGAGFIGSAVVRHLLDDTDASIVNIDKLTYASNLESIPKAANNPRYALAKVDICNGPALRALFEKYQPHAVMHLAAESHVDRSIDGPAEFIQTNVVGTFTLLQEALHYWRTVKEPIRKIFVSCMFRQTRCLVPWDPTGCSPKRALMPPTPPTLQARLPQTIWFEPGVKPTNCRQ